MDAYKVVLFLMEQFLQLRLVQLHDIHASVYVIFFTAGYFMIVYCKLLCKHIDIKNYKILWTRDQKFN